MRGGEMVGERARTKVTVRARARTRRGKQIQGELELAYHMVSVGSSSE